MKPKTFMTIACIVCNPSLRARVGQWFFVPTTLWLAGCAIGPGMNVPSDHDKPPITLITPALIAAQKSSAHTHINSLLRTFSQSSGEYRIGPTDVLAIGVVSHAELAPPDAPLPARDGHSQPNGFVIDATGHLNYRYVGDVDAANKTVQEVRSDLTQKRARSILEPQVALRVIGFRSKHAVGGP